MVTVRNPTPKLSDELYKAMQAVLDSLFNQKDAEFRSPSPRLSAELTSCISDRDVSEAFHDLLPKRQFADYYKLIKHPQALNPVQVSQEK